MKVLGLILDIAIAAVSIFAIVYILRLWKHEGKDNG